MADEMCQPCTALSLRTIQTISSAGPLLPVEFSRFVRKLLKVKTVHLSISDNDWLLDIPHVRNKPIIIIIDHSKVEFNRK